MAVSRIQDYNERGGLNAPALPLPPNDNTGTESIKNTHYNSGSGLWRQWTGPLVAFAFGLLAIHRRLLQSIPWEAQLCSGHDLVVSLLNCLQLLFGSPDLFRRW